LAFFTLWRLFEPENENPLVKWAEKFFSKLYYALEDCGTWVSNEKRLIIDQDRRAVRVLRIITAQRCPVFLPVGNIT